MMRAAVYSRYSSDLQRPASIEDQVRQCRAEIARRGWQEVATYSDSELAGTIAQRRPDYQRLLTAAKAREFDVVVVDELSRLTRDPEELARLRKLMRHWQVELVALADGLDTIAAPGAASTIIAIKGLTNEMELEANAHRSRRGLAGRVLAGHHAGGLVYGYRTRPVHADQPGDPPGTGRVFGYEFVFQEEEAEIIRRVFRLYVEGMSGRQIAALLNAEGIPPPGARWKNRLGCRRTWSNSAIDGDRRKGTGLLNQEKYIGRHLWNRSAWPKDPEQDGKQVRRERPPEEWVESSVPLPSIVSQELWDQAKARQRKRSRGSPQSAAHWRDRRLLSGLLVCSQCGGNYVLRGKNTYCCATRQNRGRVVCDCMVTVNAAVAEQAVLDELQDLFCNEAFLHQLVRRVHQRWREARATRSRHHASLHGLREQLAQVETEIQNLVKAVAKGVLLNDLAEEMRAAEARRDRLRQELAAAEGAELPAALNVLPATVRRIVSDLPSMLAAGQVEPVKSALTRLVGKIGVHGEEAPGRKRPGAVLTLRGNLEAVLQLAHEKVKGCGSPGGILTPLTFRLPPRVIRLHRLQACPGGFAEERRRAVGSG
jgi:DNA invertase Pin-like site-specific DNA recombinase